MDPSVTRELHSRLGGQSRSLISGSDVNSQEVWYLRTQRLFNKPLEARPGVDWKSIYELLLPVVHYKNPFTIEVLNDEEAADILLELGYDPSRGDNWAIQQAAARGYTATVRRLLQDRRVDPSSGDSYALIAAAENGYADIVRLLMRDRRVDPSADDNFALETAVENGDLAVVQALITDQRVFDENLPYIVNGARAAGYYEIVDAINSGQRVTMSM